LQQKKLQFYFNHKTLSQNCLNLCSAKSYLQGSYFEQLVNLRVANIIMKLFFIGNWFFKFLVYTFFLDSQLKFSCGVNWWSNSYSILFTLSLCPSLSLSLSILQNGNEWQNIFPSLHFLALYLRVNMCLKDKRKKTETNIFQNFGTFANKNLKIATFFSTIYPVRITHNSE